MADIGITLSGRVRVSKFSFDNPCLGIDISVDLPPAFEGGGPIPFARDSVMLHGNATELRSFAEKILEALVGAA